MAEDKALGPLKAGLREMLESGLYADLQIYCSDGSFYNVHKMVLCSQSAFFKSAVDPRHNFPDLHFNRIRLDNDEPAAVRALLEYLYRFEYDVPRNNDKGALFLFHIKVCAIGEAYGVKGLRDQAIDRAKIVFENAATLQELRMDLAIKAIYDMDVATDSGLCHLIVELCKGKIHELLEMGEFSEAMDSVGCFGNDLVRALMSTLPRSTAHSTPKSDAATDVATPLAIKRPTHGTAGNYNARTSAANAAGLYTAQENTHDGVRRVSEGNSVSGDQETSDFQAPKHKVFSSNGASASKTTLPASPQTQTCAQCNTRETTASTLGGSGALSSQEPFLSAKTNSSSYAVFPPSPPKFMPLLGHVSVPGLPLVPTSRHGVPNWHHDFKSRIERDHIANEHIHYQSIEFEAGYQQFSREEVRLADYFPRTGLLPLGTSFRSGVTESSNPQGQSSFGSRYGDSGDATLASKSPFGAGFGSTPTAPATQQGQFSRHSPVETSVEGASTTSTNAQGKSSNEIRPAPSFGRRI